MTKHFGQAPIKIPKKVGIGPVGDEILGMSWVTYGFDENKILKTAVHNEAVENS